MCVLGIHSHAVEDNRPNRYPATPYSLLRDIELWYLMPTTRRLPGQEATDGRALVESGDIVPLLPWLLAYTRRRGLGVTGCHPKKASEEAKFQRVSLACCRAGRVGVVEPRNLLVEPRTRLATKGRGRR